MNKFEFLEKGLHNVHIKFSVNGHVLTGVIADDTLHKEQKKTATQYTYIATANLIEWKEAETKNDKQKMTALSSVIDIETIDRAERI